MKAYTRAIDRVRGAKEVRPQVILSSSATPNNTSFFFFFITSENNVGSVPFNIY